MGRKISRHGRFPGKKNRRVAPKALPGFQPRNAMAAALYYARRGRRAGGGVAAYCIGPTDSVAAIDWQASRYRTDAGEGSSVIGPGGAYAPSSITLTAMSIDENALVGSTVATIIADGFPAPTLTISADPDNKFDVSGTSLLLDGALDYETATSHSVTIQASNPSGDHFETFVIQVNDIDENAPVISTTVPANGATNVGVSTEIVITFNEAVQFGTGNIIVRQNTGSWGDFETFTLPGAIGTGPGTVSIDGANLRIRTTNNFPNSTPMAVRMWASAIDDLAGNSFAGIANDTTVAWTTAAAAATIQRDWDPLKDEGSTFDIIVDNVNGNDSNDGLTLGAAKATVQAGVNAVSPGGTVMIRDVNGTKYRERVVTTGKGGPDAANKTQIVGYQQEKPLITAAELLTGAVPCVAGDEAIVGSNWASMYKVIGFTTADITGSNPRGLFMFENERRMSPCMTRNALPQFPNSETNTYDWPDADEVIVNADPQPKILGYRLPALTDQFTQTQIENCDVIFHRDPNGTSRSTISSFDTGTDTINLTDQTRVYEGNDNQNRFVLVNCLPAMRRGQWGFVDNGATTDIYFWPFDPLNVNVNIEYSARGNVIDTDGEDNIEFRSIQMTRASEGASGVSADGNYNFTADKAGSVRGTGVNLINCRLAEAYRSITGYGMFWIHNMDDCLVENCRIEDGWGMFAFFFHGGLVTSTEGMGENNIFRNNLVQRIDKSPSRFYGQRNAWCIDNEFRDSGNEAHANKTNAYESAEYVIWAYNLFFGCSGRAVWQEASNIYFYMNWLPATYTDIDGRAITDQNNATASPGEFNGTNSDCYVIGNMFPAYRNAKLYSNGGVFGTTAWTRTNFGVMNNVINGYVFEPGRDIATGVKTNILTAGSVFDATDTVVAIEDVFEDYVAGDTREKSTSPARTAATTSVVSLPGTDGPITLESKFPGINFDRDASGAVIDRASPPMGPFADHDAVPNHGPFYINAPTLSGMPVAGNSLSANNDHYIQAKPFPTGFDIQWVRSDDQFAIDEDWEVISGATSDPYVPVAGDVGYFVARRSAPTGTTIYRYSLVNARVIAAHPITTPTLLADFPDGATKAPLEWTEEGPFTPVGQSLILFTSFNDNIVESTITATIGAQGRPAGTGTPIVMDAFILRQTRNQTTFALMPDPAAGPVTIQYQSSDGHFSFLVQVLSTGGVDTMVFGTPTATPTDTVEKSYKTTVDNSALLYVVNRYSGDFAADPIVWTGADQVTVNNTGGTSVSGDLTSSIAYEQAMPKQTYDARATWNDDRNVAAVAIGLVPATSAAVAPDAMVAGDWTLATGSAANELDLNIVSAPADNGSAITDYEYEIDASGSWVSLATATTGVVTITMAAPATSYDIRVRAVNAGGAATGSDTKTATSGASGVTDIMAGIGDFSNPALWSWDAGQAEVTGGVAQFFTTTNFRGIFARGGLAIPCPENVTLDLEMTVSNIVANSRLWINVQFRDSGGLDIGSSVKIFDTNDDGALVDGVITKAACVTAPAGTADMEIEGIDVVTQPGQFDIDNFKLTY